MRIEYILIQVYKILGKCGIHIFCKFTILLVSTYIVGIYTITQYILLRLNPSQRKDVTTSTSIYIYRFTFTYSIHRRSNFQCSQFSNMLWKKFFVILCSKVCHKENILKICSMLKLICKQTRAEQKCHFKHIYLWRRYEIESIHLLKLDYIQLPSAFYAKQMHKTNSKTSELKKLQHRNLIAVFT